MAPFCGNIADFVEARLQLLWQPRPKGNLREVLCPRLHVTGWSDFVARVRWLPFLSSSSCFPGDLSFSFSVEGRAGSLGPQSARPRSLGSVKQNRLESCFVPRLAISASCENARSVPWNVPFKQIPLHERSTCEATRERGIPLRATRFASARSLLRFTALRGLACVSWALAAMI